jgi:hypothetical protein
VHCAVDSPYYRELVQAQRAQAALVDFQGVSKPWRWQSAVRPGCSYATVRPVRSVPQQAAVAGKRRGGRSRSVSDEWSRAWQAYALLWQCVLIAPTVAEAREALPSPTGRHTLASTALLSIAERVRAFSAGAGLLRGQPGEDSYS